MFWTILDAIGNLLIKKRLDLPPNLRELDARVEVIELKLRRLVDDELEGNAELLPPHVAQKVTDRLQSAARKNPAIDDDRIATHAAKLEYFDLRELEAVVVAKPTQPRFEAQFVSKEPLIAKFGQLAELRNGLRHSRSIDEITRKEGEAAIIWFNKVLAN